MGGQRKFFNFYIREETFDKRFIVVHYLMGLGPNWKEILHNRGKQIRIPEGM